jgi:hypothetical protein
MEIAVTGAIEGIEETVAAMAEATAGKAAEAKVESAATVVVMEAAPSAETVGTFLRQTQGRNKQTSDRKLIC